VTLFSWKIQLGEALMFLRKFSGQRRKRMKLSHKLVLFFLLAGIVAIFIYHRYAKYIRVYRYTPVITQAANLYSLDPNLIKSVIWQESSFEPDIIGSKGEIGLMQIMKGSAVQEWANAHHRPIPDRGMLFLPEINIQIGSWYLSYCKRHWTKYKNWLPLTLAEYNAGYSNAKNWVPDNPNEDVIQNITFQSTREYVQAIIDRYAEYEKR
jgi:soluble lytic murein transglycosylase